MKLLESIKAHYEAEIAFINLHPGNVKDLR